MTRNPRLSLAIGILLLSPLAAGAQTGSISIVVAAPNHELMADPLGGGSALIALPLSEGGHSLRLQVEWLAGNAHRTGIPCAGLIELGTCPPEPLVDDARMTTVAIGLGFPLLRRARFDAGVTVDARLGNVSVDTRGRVSGDGLRARRFLWGGDVGLQGSWIPSERMPLALEAAIGAGGLRPAVREQVLDGYTPFEDGFTVRRARLGIAWRGPRR